MRIQLHLLAIVCASAVLTLGCQPAQEAATTEPAAEAPKAPTSEPNAAAPSPRGEPGDAPAAKAEGQPNIVVIWGDDIGISNLSTYSEGLMGYSTPNIDRIAREGMKFTDYYAEQSCTAGRSAFITGQSVFRTGLSKVGLPGATQGLSDQDPTIAELLKSQGYATGQFGKNHLGDRNEFLPTVHGFDEFYGNLYHLNAEEEPEEHDYPKNPAFKAKYGPRGVMDCKASTKDDTTVDPRFGKVGKQVCKDTGPLTRKRMETVDDDIAARAQDFIRRQTDGEQPFFVWVNFTHMHLWTHTKPESVGQAGEFQSQYHDTMIDHDKNVGSILDELDELGIAENTIVIYGTDNGPHMNSWPDSAMTPFRSEKNTGWEGGFRVPFMVRWPDKIRQAQSRTRSCRTSTGRLLCLPPLGNPTSRRSSSRATRLPARSSRYTSTATISCPTSPAKRRPAPESSISTFPMTGTCWPCGTATGRCSSRFKTSLERCGSGSGSSRTFDFRICST